MGKKSQKNVFFPFSGQKIIVCNLAGWERISLYNHVVVLEITTPPK